MLEPPFHPCLSFPSMQACLCSMATSTGPAGFQGFASGSSHVAPTLRNKALCRRLGQANFVKTSKRSPSGLIQAGAVACLEPFVFGETCRILPPCTAWQHAFISAMSCRHTLACTHTYNHTLHQPHTRMHTPFRAHLRLLCTPPAATKANQT